MTRPLQTILEEEGIRFSGKAVRSSAITVRPSDDWVIHRRIVGANTYTTGLAPVDHILLALPFVAVALGAAMVLIGWDIGLPLGLLAAVLACWLAIRSFDRLLDLLRHKHAMKDPVYAVDLERGSQYCEFFTSKDADEVRLVSDALEEFLTSNSFSNSGVRRRA